LPKRSDHSQNKRGRGKREGTGSTSVITVYLRGKRRGKRRVGGGRVDRITNRERVRQKSSPIFRGEEKGKGEKEKKDFNIYNR